MELPSIDLTIVVAVIGGLSGVLAALITAKVTTTAAKRQGDRTDARNAAYLATQVAPALRAYAATCKQVSFDDGEVDETPNAYTGIYDVTVYSPTFDPQSFQVEWKSLPADLMAEVLTFPEAAHTASYRLEGREYDDPPDYFAFFTDRKRIYAELGLKAVQLAARLHSHAKLAIHQEGARLTRDLKVRLEMLDEERDRRDQLIDEQHTERLAMHNPGPPTLGA